MREQFLDMANAGLLSVADAVNVVFVGERTRVSDGLAFDIDVGLFLNWSSHAFTCSHASLFALPVVRIKQLTHCRAQLTQSPPSLQSARPTPTGAP
jgi:hypothetical protein